MRRAHSDRGPVAQSVVEGVSLSAHGPARPPVVAMLHGLEDDWQSWKPVTDGLGDRFRCYAIDLPWRAGGDYGWRAGGTAGQWVERALEIVPEPVSVVVAHSMGANAVLHWLTSGAARRLDAVVLLSPFYRLTSVPVDWRMFDRSLADFRAVMKAGLRARLGERAARIGPELVDLMAEKALDRIGPEGFLALFDQFISSSGLDLAANTVPTLVVGGTADAGLSGPRAEALGLAMPSAEIRLEDGLTHFCHIEQPHRVAELVAEFLLRTTPAFTKAGQRPGPEGATP
ncbi:alpha/beta fold hydrolase [Kitasatospora sp. NPDC056181]|uniref:alpha/beta fold hydrolase n=1 Tax=Kitasatospora sp. NPDC056181 TaxID=3345737 RepID=UPI0035E2ADAA